VRWQHTLIPVVKKKSVFQRLYPSTNQGESRDRALLQGLMAWLCLVICTEQIRKSKRKKKKKGEWSPLLPMFNCFTPKVLKHGSQPQCESFIDIIFSRHFIIKRLGPVLVAHTCNPSYSGGRDQEDRVRRQPGQIVLETLSQKKLFTKKSWCHGSRCGTLSSSPTTTKKKKG
jgi:hypothetical protein